MAIKITFGILCLVQAGHRDGPSFFEQKSILADLASAVRVCAAKTCFRVNGSAIAHPRGRNRRLWAEFGENGRVPNLTPTTSGVPHIHYWRGEDLNPSRSVCPAKSARAPFSPEMRLSACVTGRTAFPLPVRASGAFVYILEAHDWPQTGRLQCERVSGAHSQPQRARAALPAAVPANCGRGWLPAVSRAIQTEAPSNYSTSGGPVGR